jgi:glycine/D-amino acid oxidase-like deaminating enzyme
LARNFHLRNVTTPSSQPAAPVREGYADNSRKKIGKAATNEEELSDDGMSGGVPAQVLPQSTMLQHPWLANYRLPPKLQAQPLSTLPGNKVDVDAVVVGNGIGGLTLADALAKYPMLKGSKVALVSSGDIGQFGNSPAMMMRTRIVDGDYQELLNSLGPEEFSQLLSSSEKAYTHMSNLLGDASHPTNSYYFSWTDSAATPDAWLRTSLKPLTQVPGVKYLTPEELANVPPFIKNTLELKGEAHIDPVEALHKIAGARPIQDNVRLLQGTVTGITRDADGLIRLTTADGRQITTRRAFFATNSPPPFLGSPRTFPEFEPWEGTTLVARAPQTKLGTANYYDTEDITFFRNVIGLDGRPLVRVGGNAPDTPDAILRRLDPTANILRRTESQLPLSPDGRPIIDEVPGLPGVYVNLGFNGTGTLGAGFGPPVIEQLLKTGVHPAPKLFGINREFIEIRPEPEP